MLHRAVAVIATAVLVVLFGPLPPVSRAEATAAPYMVKDINPQGGIQAWNLTAWKGKLLFQINNTAPKDGLWASDGTAHGTTRVKRPDVSTERFVTTKRNVFFKAEDGANGRVVWRTDGTKRGTRTVRPLLQHANLIGGAGNLAFLRDAPAPSEYQLVRTNGKRRGTRALTLVNPGDGTAVGKTLFFAGDDQTNAQADYALWKSDGSAQGTALVKEIAGAGNANPSGMTVFGSELRFFARDDANEYGLWKSDGTENGTTLIKALGQNATGAGQVQVGDTLFFVLRTTDTKLFELWVSNGTELGTEMIYDLGTSDDADPPTLEGVGDTLFFGRTFAGLYKSNGTTEGTVELLDGNMIRRMAHIGNMLYFVNADNTHGYELWQSNGTPEGTVMVADINSQPADTLGSLPDSLTPVGDTLFFTADEGVHGIELWAYTP